MNPPLTTPHTHRPLYRVVRRDAADPLDPSPARRKGADCRWNTPDFAALYCCCSEWVARAVTLERFRRTGVDLGDLETGARPQLVEIEWSGEVVDVVSREGVAAAGFNPRYPEGVRKVDTRRAAQEWYATGQAGVVCRSAALLRRGFSNFAGEHHHWGELAIFLDNSQERPKLLRRREDLTWLTDNQP